MQDIIITGTHMYAFRFNYYRCPAPPVCHVGWGLEAWCFWIYNNGTFFNLDHCLRAINQIHINRMVAVEMLED